MAADIAEFGVRIRAPEGADQSVSAFGKIEAASKKSSRAVDSHAGSFEKLASTMAKNSSGASMLLRQLGGLGGAGAELAERLERVALQGERMTANAAKQLSSQDVLNKAYRDGAIAAATIEAAQLRLNSARQAAAIVESRYAAAVADNAAKQAALRSAQAATGLAQVGVTSERQYLTDAQARMASTTSLKEYEIAEMAAARASANLAAEQKILSSAMASQKIAMVEAKEANAALAAVTQERTAANVELAASEKLVSAAGAATGIGVAGAAAMIAGLVATLIVLAAAFETVKKAWELFRDSIKAGAEEQKAEFPFRQMVGNITLAEEKLKELHELANSQGNFDFAGLVSAAQQMIVLGTGADNLIPRVTQLATLAAASGQSIDAMTQAYARTEQAIINHTELMTRGMNGSRIILQALMADLGKSQGQVQSMFKAGQISIEMVNHALDNATKSGGLFGQTLADYLKTLPGAMGQLANSWEQVKAEFGKPIAAGLAEGINVLSGNVEGLIPLAREAGESVGHVISALALIAKEDGWQTALLAAWEIVVFTMAKTATEILLDTFSRLGPILGRALLDGLKGGAMEFVTSFALQLGAEFGAKLQDAQAKLESALARTAITPASRGVGAATDALGGGLQARDLALGTAGGKESDWEKYNTDLQIINDYWEEYNMIQSKAQTETERTRRTIELEMKTAKALSDPAAYAKDFTTIQGRWAAMEAERVKATEDADMRIKSGQASVFEAMMTGIDKVTHAWGNSAQKMEKAVGDIANALVNDLSSGITDIITGTKDAETGFREMAVSILRDIAQIIVKMEIEILLQTILNGLRGGAGAAGGTAGGAGGAYAGGGPIMGPSHALGGVRLEAEGGEFIIRKDRVRSEGMDKMALLNEGKATIMPKYLDGGMVYGGSHYGANPRTLNPPYHGDAYGNAADYEFFQSNLSTRFRGGIEGAIPPAAQWRPNYPGVGGNYPRQSDIDQARDALYSGPTAGAGAGAGVDMTYSGGAGIGAWLSGLGAGVLGGASLTGSSGARISGSVGNMGSGGVGIFGEVHVGQIQPNTALGVYQVWTGTQWQAVGGLDASASVIAANAQAAVGGRATFNSPAGGITGGAGTSTGGHYDYGQGRYVGGLNASGAQFSNTGNANFQSGAAAAMEMWYQSMGGNPNNTGTTGDAGHTIYYPNAGTPMGHADEGVVTPTGGTFGSGQRDPRWVFPSQTESARLGLSFSATKYNDWLMAHNQWFYSAIPTHHAGGIVGSEGSFLHMATGGPVDDQLINARKGEGVFTRGQMAAIGAGMSGPSAVHIAINVDSHDNVTSSSSDADRMSDDDWKRLAKVVEGMTVQTLQKQRRYKGAAYRSRTGAPA